MICVGRRRPTGASVMPRSMAAASIPLRFTAVRWPASARLTAAPCTWTPRTRTRAPVGISSNSSPSLISPAIRVPVTTAPKPRIVNARSIGSRVMNSEARSGTCDPNSRSAFFNASSFSPVRELTARIGAPSRKDPAINSSVSARTSWSNSSSTRSFLVITTKPCLTPSRRQMSKCSRVCGITLSSAAMTRATRSIPCAPANMFFTRRSCPGTSTKPICTSPKSRSAKPMSIVIPLRFSSGSRSASMPVSARTNAVLPWSICPAVPTMIDFISLESNSSCRWTQNAPIRYQIKKRGLRCRKKWIRGRNNWLAQHSDLSRASII